MSFDNLSPVTEAEVMNFASRVCTAIVAHSQQQSEIDNLTSTVSSQKSELEHLRGENARLNTDVGETTTLADGYSRERDDAMRRVQELEGKLRYQEEMALQRDGKVSSLQTENANLKNEADSARRELEALDNSHKDLSSALAATRGDRDHWRQAAGEAETNLRNVSVKLDKIPLPIRAHFTGEDMTPKVEPKQVPITESAPQPHDASVEWKTQPEMKPVVHDEEIPF